MRWKDYKTAFEFDGSWRDLYVLHTTIDDWQRLFDFLSTGAYPVTFSLDGQSRGLPARAQDVFQERLLQKGALLSINVNGVIINSHFFQEDEIEMDIDPREITGPSKAESVFGFMASVADALGKPVRMTYENTSQGVLFEYDPGTRILQSYPPFGYIE